MAGRDLERLSQTRIMPVSHRPDAIYRGGKGEVSPRALKAGGVRAVGNYRQVAPGEWTVPVVYVSQRALPWHERRWVHVTAIVSGAVLSLGALIFWAIATMGALGFVATLLASVAVIACLVRFSRGGGRRGVSVTTTTSVRVR